MAGGIRLQVEDPQRWVEESPRRGLDSERVTSPRRAEKLEAFKRPVDPQYNG